MLNALITLSPHIGIMAMLIGIVAFARPVLPAINPAQGDLMRRQIARTALSATRSIISVEVLLLLACYPLVAAFAGLEAAAAFAGGACLAFGCAASSLLVSLRSSAKLAALLNKAMPGDDVARKLGNLASLGALLVSGLTVAVLAILWFTLSSSDKSRSLLWFAMGTSIAVFLSRVGGGIFNKAADIGADLLNQSKNGFREDDPRNPLTVADHVGDKIGGSMGATLEFIDCLLGSLVAVVVLTKALPVGAPAQEGLLALPIVLIVLALATSMALAVLTWIMRYTVKPADVLKGEPVVAVVLFLLAAWFVLPYAGLQNITIEGRLISNDQLWTALAAGAGSGLVLSLLSAWYSAGPPLTRISAMGKNYPALSIIGTLALGLQSTIIPCLVLVMAMFFAHKACGVFGTALAALGLSCQLAANLSVSFHRPMADAVIGLLNFSGLKNTQEQLNRELHELARTGAVMSRGSAVAATALTSFALFFSFKEFAASANPLPSQAHLLGAILLGAMLPFALAAHTLSSVGETACALLEQTLRIFEKPLEKELCANSAECSKIALVCSRAAMKGMLLPGVVVLTLPVLIGYLISSAVLGAFVSGVLVSGIVLSVFMTSTGGAFSAGAAENQRSESSYTNAHKRAAHLGNAIGDPFKDTAAPSLNSLIRLLSLMALGVSLMLGR